MGNRRIRFVIVLDSCCISIGLVFIKDRPVSSFWALRFRDLGVFLFEFWMLCFRDLGVFVFEIWVLRASVFVFECFVFETTEEIRHSAGYPFSLLFAVGYGKQIAVALVKYINRPLFDENKN